MKKTRILFIALALLMTACLLFSACEKKEKVVSNPQGSFGVTITPKPNTTDNSAPSAIKVPEPGSSNSNKSGPLTIRADKVTANVGEKFSMFVYIDGSADYENWAALDLVIPFDPNLYSVDEVIPTSLTSTSVVDSSFVGSDKVKLAISTYADLDFGAVVELKCTAKAAGTFEGAFTDADVYLFVIENGTANTVPAKITLDPVNVTIKIL